MALSGSFMQTFNNNELHSLIIEWTATQNQKDNYSDVTATLYLKGNHPESTIISGAVTKPTSITINGKKSSIAYPRVDIRGKEKRKLMSYTQRIHHDSNGNGSFSITGTLDVRITWNGRWEATYQMGTRTFSLDPIQRASTLTLNSPSINYGDKVRFTINASNGNFRHIVKLDVAGFNGNMMTNQTAGYKEFQTSRNWMTSLSSSTNTTGTITLDTYSGNSRIGRMNYTIRFNVPSDVSPTFSNLGHTEMNSTVSNVIGSSTNKYVQGLSRIKFTISTSSGYNSNVTSTKVEVGGIKLHGDTFDLSNHKHIRGTVSYEVSAIDSRGRAVTSKGNLDIIPYNPPKISSFTTSRSENGNINVNRSGSISPVTVNGYSKNSMTSRLYIQEYGSTYWREYGSAMSSFSNTTISNIDKSKSFLVKSTLSDRFLTVESQNTVATEKVLLNLHKEYGLGIGKMHEKGILDVVGDSYFEGTVYGRNGFFTEGISMSYRVPTDLDVLRGNITYRVGANDSVSSRPPITSEFFLDVNTSRYGVVRQIATSMDSNPDIYIRIYDGYRWGKWNLISGRRVSEIPEKSNLWSHYSSGINKPMAIREGNVVTLFGAFRNNEAFSLLGDKESPVTQLPRGFAPAKPYITRQQGSGAGSFMITIDTNGIVKFSRYNTTHTGGYTNVQVGTWFNIYCTFITGGD